MKSKNLIDSFKYAGQGLKTVFSSERNFRIHCAAVVIVVALCIICRLSFLECAVVFLASGFVLVAELANTAIEKMVDMITQEYSEEAKAVKDIAAGVVLIAAAIAVFVGIFVFAQPLLRLIGE